MSFQSEIAWAVWFAIRIRVLLLWVSTTGGETRSVERRSLVEPGANVHRHYQARFEPGRHLKRQHRTKAAIREAANPDICRRIEQRQCAARVQRVLQRRLGSAFAEAHQAPGIDVGGSHREPVPQVGELFRGNQTA